MRHLTEQELQFLEAVEENPLGILPSPMLFGLRDMALIEHVEASELHRSGWRLTTIGKSTLYKGSRWRSGRKLGRTMYVGDQYVGIMDTTELSHAVCEAMNDLLEKKVVPRWRYERAAANFRRESAEVIRLVEKLVAEKPSNAEETLEKVRVLVKSSTESYEPDPFELLDRLTALLR